MNRRAVTVGFVVGGALAFGSAFALAGDDPSNANSGQISPAAQKAFETGEVAIPDPADVTPVSEPNRVGTFSEEYAKECQQTDPPPVDPISCDLIEAVDHGLVEEGQELSNEELDRVLEEERAR